MARAIGIAESWRVSAHRVLAASTESDFDVQATRIFRQLARHGSEGVSLRDLHRSMRDRSPSELRDVIDQLVSIRELEEMHLRPGPEGGRPATRYRRTNQL